MNIQRPDPASRAIAATAAQSEPIPIDEAQQPERIEPHAQGSGGVIDWDQIAAHGTVLRAEFGRHGAIDSSQRGDTNAAGGHAAQASDAPYVPTYDATIADWKDPRAETVKPLPSKKEGIEGAFENATNHVAYLQSEFGRLSAALATAPESEKAAIKTKMNAIVRLLSAFTAVQHELAAMRETLLNVLARLQHLAMRVIR